MERQELLSQLNALLESYGNHKAFADKAREQASSFSSSVIKFIAFTQIVSMAARSPTTSSSPTIGFHTNRNSDITHIETF